MVQFQVYLVADGRLVLDLQTDLIETGTRVVAALARNSHRWPLMALHGAADGR